MATTTPLNFTNSVQRGTLKGLLGDDRTVRAIESLFTNQNTTADAVNSNSSDITALQQALAALAGGDNVLYDNTGRAMLTGDGHAILTQA